MSNRLVFVTALGLLLFGNGCSVAILSVVGADRGNPFPVSESQSRDAIEAKLGTPLSVRQLPDGVAVALYDYQFRAADPKAREMANKSLGLWTSFVGGYGGAFPLGVFTELFFFPYAIYKAAEQRPGSQLTAVYGQDDRLLFFYFVETPPVERFEQIRRPRAWRRWEELASDHCQTWSACLRQHVDEVRRQAVWVDYPLPLKEEENLERLLELALDFDTGRISKGEALIRLDGRLRGLAIWSGSPWDVSGILQQQLATDRCPQWVACVTIYDAEHRRLTAAKAFELHADYETDLQRALEIARSLDGGTMTKGEALKALTP